MHGVALDGTWPDDRHLDHEIVQVLRSAARQGLHLGPPLDLEDAHGVGRTDHAEDLGDVLGQAVEVDDDRAVGCDVSERVVDRGEHSQAQQVEFDEFDGLDVAFVVLHHDTTRHRGPFERRDVDQRRGRDEHPAGVDRQVSREAIDARGQLQPPIPRRQPSRRGMRQRRRATAAARAASSGTGTIGIGQRRRSVRAQFGRVPRVIALGLSVNGLRGPSGSPAVAEGRPGRRL